MAGPTYPVRADVVPESIAESVKQRALGIVCAKTIIAEAPKDLEPTLQFDEIIPLRLVPVNADVQVRPRAGHVLTI